MPETTELTVPETLHIAQTGPEPTPEGEEAKSGRPGPGEEIRRRIAERYEREQRSQELALAETMADEARERAAADVPTEPVTPEPPPPAPPEPPAPAEPPPAAPAAPAEPEAPPPVEPPAAAAAKHKLTINGQDIALTDDELVSLARTGIIASQQNFQRQAAPGAPAVSPPPAPSTPAEGTAPPRDIIDDAAARELARRIAYGSDEDQANAVKDLARRTVSSFEGRQQTPPLEKLVFAAKEQAKAEIRFEQNLEVIGNEYPDIFKDSDLTLLAAKRVGELRQKQATLAQAAMAEGRQPSLKPDIALYREACSEVKSRYLAAPSQSVATASPPVQAAPAPVVATTERLERKRAAPKPPAAANATATMPELPRPPSGSDIVEMMRKARGQPSMR